MLVFDPDRPKSVRLEAPSATTWIHFYDAMEQRLGGPVRYVTSSNGEFEAVTRLDWDDRGARLPSNPLACRTLQILGFQDGQMGISFFFGPVILMGRDRSPLSNGALRSLACFWKDYGLRVRIRPMLTFLTVEHKQKASLGVTH